MVTREFLIYFRYLEDVIENDKKALERLKNKPPQRYFDKVMGSNSEFPYEQKSFKVEGAKSAEYNAYIHKIATLERKIALNIRFYEKIKLEILELIANIENPRDKAVFQHLIYDKMTQEQVARKLFVNQSVVSRTIDKYVTK